MFQSSTNRRLFALGSVTILMSVMTLVNNLLEFEFELWVSVGALALSMLVFIWAYLVDGEGYAAIGAYVMLAILSLISLTTWMKLEGPLVPSFVLAAIALPFIFVWFNRQENWGFLVPAYVLLAIIPIFFISEGVAPELVPAYVLTMIAIPFVVAYFVSRKWAYLIPSAVLFIIALSFVGLAFGMPMMLMYVGLPVLTLLVGLYLLWKALTERPEEKGNL